MLMFGKREMPTYANVLHEIECQTFVPASIGKQLGESAVAEFQKICQEGVLISIPVKSWRIIQNTAPVI